MSADKHEPTEHFIPTDTRPDLRIDLDAKIGDLTPAQIQSVLAAYNPATTQTIVGAMPVAVAIIIAIPGGAKIIKDDVDHANEKMAKDTKDRKDTKETGDRKGAKESKDEKDATDRKTEKDNKDSKDGKDTPDTERRKHEKDRADNKQSKDGADQKAEADRKGTADDKITRDQTKTYNDKPNKDNKDLKDGIESAAPRSAAAALEPLLAAALGTGSLAAASSMTLRELLTKIGVGGGGGGKPPGGEST